MVCVTHYIYIPGLGKNLDILRKVALFTWKFRRGVSVDLVSIDWEDTSESLADKQAQVAGFIDRVGNETQVVLVGESAGGAIAITVASKYKDRIDKVVTICGKNRRPEAIHPVTADRYPVLVRAVEAAESVLRNENGLSKKQLYVIYSTGDKTIDPKDTRISGAEELAVNVRGHFMSIAYILLCKFGYVRDVS